jgi:hypothetical protein
VSKQSDAEKLYAAVAKVEGFDHLPWLSINATVIVDPDIDRFLDKRTDMKLWSHEDAQTHLAEIDEDALYSIFYEIMKPQGYSYDAIYEVYQAVIESRDRGALRGEHLKKALLEFWIAYAQEEYRSAFMDILPEIREEWGEVLSMDEMQYRVRNFDLELFPSTLEHMVDSLNSDEEGNIVFEFKGPLPGEHEMLQDYITVPDHWRTAASYEGIWSHNRALFTFASRMVEDTMQRIIDSMNDQPWVRFDDSVELMYDDPGINEAIREFLSGPEDPRQQKLFGIRRKRK